jgi:hypothetical protein
VSQYGAKCCKPSQMVAGGRYELYSNYALKIQAVAASQPQFRER